jgi:AraC-like DNA-binding protein
VELGRLLALCAERAGCPELGLLLGEPLDLGVLGLVGELGGHCPDLGSALRNIILYLHLHDRGAVPALWVSGERAMLAYVIHQHGVPGTELIYDLALTVTRNVLKALAGPGWKATEVHFSRPQPATTEHYRRVFQTRLIFGADYDAVVFPSAWLAQPLGGADAMVHQRIMQEIERLEAHGAGDLPAQLRRVLRRLLVDGAGIDETSLDQISQIFRVHRRTLNRRLRIHGTSFKALLDECRYDIARQLLRDTRLPVAEVAARLGYADAAAFSRAFRRWSGRSPAAWRVTQSPG